MKTIIASILIGITCSVMANDMVLNTTKTLFVWPWQSQLVVSVKANPATGYDWLVKQYSWDRFNLVGQGFLKSENSEFLGAPGHYQFIFDILKPFNDTQQIILALKAPWEDHPIITKTFLVRVLETTQGPVY